MQELLFVASKDHGNVRRSEGDASWKGLKITGFKVMLPYNNSDFIKILRVKYCMWH